MVEDKITKKLLEHNERPDRLVAKGKSDDLRDKMLHNHEEIMAILKRLDEKRIFIREWVKRIESKLERQEQEMSLIKAEINNIKFQLKIP